METLNGFLVDTNAVAGGEIFQLARILRRAAIDLPLLVPTFVLDEAAAIAYSGDRAKEKAGKDALYQLALTQGERIVQVLQIETGPKTYVDDRLLDLAQEQKYGIITSDRELLKRAEENGVPILNPKELLAIRPPLTVSCGQAIDILIRSAGRQNGQGTGELDGIPIFVENAGDKIGQNVTVMIDRVIDNEKRLIFGHRIETAGCPS